MKALDRLRVVSVLGCLLVGSATTLLSGCALTGKADAFSIRYFTPETVKPHLTSANTKGANTNPNASDMPQLELGRVTSGLHLRDKIAYRDAAFEVGYYDDRRWTERPEVFVRRELARTLFEEHGFRRTLAGQAPVLDIEVIAFEEVRGKSPNGSSNALARIRLRMIVHDDRDAMFERTITVDRPVAQGGGSTEGLVQAMAEALDAAAEDVAKETEGVLRSRPKTDKAPSPETSPQ